MVAAAVPALDRSAQMLSQRRLGFGGVHRAEIDFHAARGQPGDSDAAALELVFVVRNAEPGASPVFMPRAMSRTATSTLSTQSMSTIRNLVAQRIVTHSRMPPGANYPRLHSQGTLLSAAPAAIIDAQLSMIIL